MSFPELYTGWNFPNYYYFLHVFVIQFFAVLLSTHKLPLLSILGIWQYAHTAIHAINTQVVRFNGTGEKVVKFVILSSQAEVSMYYPFIWTKNIETEILVKRYCNFNPNNYSCVNSQSQSRLLWVEIVCRSQ